MPDMSEFHESEEEMEDRCDAQRGSEKLDIRPAPPRRRAVVDPRTGLKYPEVEYHDCPGAALGTCDPANPKPGCPDCGGKGYVEGAA